MESGNRSWPSQEYYLRWPEAMQASSSFCAGQHVHFTPFVTDHTASFDMNMLGPRHSNNVLCTTALQAVEMLQSGPFAELLKAAVASLCKPHLTMQKHPTGPCLQSATDGSLWAAGAHSDALDALDGIEGEVQVLQVGQP